MKCVPIVFTAIYLLAAGPEIYPEAQQEVQPVSPAEIHTIALWGAPAWGNDDYGEDKLAAANEWAVRRFGARFTISCLPVGADRFQALQLQLAGGSIPDFISLGEYSETARALLQELAESGTIMPLDQYFHRPLQFPHLARIGRNYEFKQAYIHDGLMYAIPGWNT